MNNEHSGKLLRLEQREEGITILWMDDPGGSVNTLHRGLIEEFEVVLAQLEADRELRVLVFGSGKPDSFVAGADLEMLLAVEAATEAQALAEVFQSIQNRIAALPASGSVPGPRGR